MNQEQLESLPYPMFETTDEEKECLKLALPLIEEEGYNYFLCNILHWDIGNFVAEAIVGKISKALNDGGTLSGYCGLGDNNDDTLQAELRRIWIRKLLAYKGE